MLFLRAPSGASEFLAHAVELINRDLDGIMDNLDTHRQNEFWTELHQYALAQIRNPGATTQLVAGEHVNNAVREALQMTDDRLTTHMRQAGNEDRARLWQMIHDAAEQQIRDTKHPKARHGGGGQSA